MTDRATCDQRSRGILLAVVDADGSLPALRHRREADLLKLAHEDTLREGSRESPSPGGRVREDLWRKIVVHHDVGHDETPARAEHAVHLGKDARLARREVDDSARQRHVYRGVRKRDVLQVPWSHSTLLRPISAA